MLPVVALVGRPNVGKSTLFNVLTGTRDALVADLPGLTRDRKFGYGRRGGRYIVVDTGGLVASPEGIEALMAAQTERAVAEADRVIFVVDAQSGTTSADRYVADRLRRSGKPVTLAVNKSEGRDPDIAASDFHAFGFGEPVTIAAAHQLGIEDLMARVLAGLRAPDEDEAEEEDEADEEAEDGETGADPDDAGFADDADDPAAELAAEGDADAEVASGDAEDEEAPADAGPEALADSRGSRSRRVRLPPVALPDEGIRVAVVGRPNVGKSTLINRLLGEERLIAYDQPGTTRDSVEVPFERDGRKFVLIDTAGVRRKARIEETIEKYSVVKALQAIDEAHVVIGVLDGHETIADQDASLFGMVAERGRALILAINKWDNIPPDQRDHIRNQLLLKVPFLEFAPQHFISALHGSGVGKLLVAVRRAYEASMREMPTPELTRVLEAALQAHQPPLVRGRRIKLRYAHQGGRNPPVIVIHGNQVEHVPDAFRRYLVNTFREAFRLYGTPVRVEFRSDPNPFAGRRNVLSERQIKKRRRLMRHAKRR